MYTIFVKIFNFFQTFTFHNLALSFLVLIKKDTYLKFADGNTCR